MENVRCPGCGEENPARFRLCGFCGTALHPVPETVHCPSCGEENPGRFRLCGFCGAALAPAASGSTAGTARAPLPAPTPLPLAGRSTPATPAPMVPVIDLPAHEVRKVVTLLFSDLKDSTAITASIDAEAMNEIKARYFASMAAEIERHGGNVEKNIGDAIMAVFGRIRAHEDDALRAVRAAAGTQRILEQLNEELFRVYGVRISNRTGVNTGEVVASTDPNAVQNLATGEAVNIAARLEQNAPANEVLLGELTYDLVKQHVDVERLEIPMKGYTEPVPAYRLVAVREGPVEPASAVRTAPLVGRDEELRRLRSSFAAAADTRQPRLVTVIGEPGVGKSRLVKDFVAELVSSAVVVRGRCLPYGDGITFWPLSEMARIVAGIEQEDAPERALARLRSVLPPVDDRDAIVERLAVAINLSPARFPVAELFWAGRRFLEVLGTTRGIVVVVDDIHSAETTFLEFIEHVLDASRSVPILILCTARHALVEKHPDWGRREQSEIIQLAPLSLDDASGLVRQLLGDAGLDEEIQTKVVTAAQGNPLFVEQLVSMLVDKGMLRREGERWVPARDVADLAVPPTIQALLASRLDDLTREERAVVEPASVIGLVFYEPAIEAMVPEQVRTIVPDELGVLGEKQFVLREPGDEDAERYRFRHLLIRDAAYGSLLKRARAQLHERFVAWAEPVNRERGREQEFEEILGYHLEQAFRYRSELGPIDAAGREVASRAAAKLGNAGRRAYARGDLPAAASLLRRAAALLDHDRIGRVEALCDLAQVIQESGQFDDAQAVIDQAVALASELGDRRLIARTRLLVGLQDVFDAAQAGRNLVEDALEAIAVFQAVDDPASEAHGWRLVAAVHGTAGRYDAAAEASLREIEAARRAGDGLTLARGSIGFAISVLHGPAPVPEALERVATLAQEVAGDRRSQAFIVLIRALLMALDGRFDEARALGEDGRRMLLELGPSVAASSTSNERARIELLAGDPSEAARQLTADLDDLTALGEKYFRANVAGLLSIALARLNDAGGAEAAAGLARSLADADDTEAQVLWRSGLGRTRALQGRAEEAITLLQEAADLASGTTDLLLQADALADLGETLATLGRTNESGPPLEEALGRYAQKAARIPADRVRTLLSQQVLTA